MCEYPGRIGYRLTPLKFIIQRAYKVQDLEVSGPDWLSSDRFDIDAKMPDGDSNADLAAMLQTLLVERFDLSFHNETRDLAGFVLTVEPSGAKLDSAKDQKGYSMPRDRSGVHLKGVLTVQTLADVLSQTLRRPVINQTGLEGPFAMSLDFAPDTLDVSDNDSPALPLPAAISKQLGLKLEPKKVPVKLIIIDHIDKLPDDN
jgi:uncharacterized protein (TIGR03435 family)